MKKKIAARAQNIPVERHRLTFAILRLIRGKTATVVAAKAGVAYHTVLNLRRPVEDGGTLCPRVSVVDKIGRAYGMRLQLVEFHDGRTTAARQHREDRSGATASLN